MGMWNSSTMPESMKYLDAFVEAGWAEWMAVSGYQGEMWKGRNIPTRDPNEYPARGCTYTQAADLAQYINAIAAETNGISLVSQAVHVWANYQGGPGQANAYCPVPACMGFDESDWNSLCDFQILVGTAGGNMHGPSLHSAVLLYGQMEDNPTSVITSFFAGELGFQVSVTQYNPGYNALLATFRSAWAKALRSPNTL